VIFLWEKKNRLKKTRAPSISSAMLEICGVQIKKAVIVICLVVESSRTTEGEIEKEIFEGLSKSSCDFMTNER
jgi:hypothetical protein